MAYNETRGIPIDWDHRINVIRESCYGSFETNYVMFKYIVNNVEKTCMCLVYENKIVRVCDIDVQINYDTIHM